MTESELSDEQVEGPRYCARHPKEETLLSCGRCGTPICPKCMVYTPTGIRCPQCAQVRRMPQYELTAGVYLRVIPGAILLALAIGFLLSYAPGIASGFFGGIIVGLVVAAGLKRVSGYKQGREMEVIAGATVVLTVLAGNLFGLLRYGSHIDAALRVVFSAQFLGVDAIGIVIGIYIAVQRLR